MAGVDALLPETVDDEDIENAIQEFENDAMDGAGIDEMDKTFELELELVKVFPMAKKNMRTVSQPPTRAHSSNSATDEWNTTTVTYLFLLIL